MARHASKRNKRVPDYSHHSTKSLAMGAICICRRNSKAAGMFGGVFTPASVSLAAPQQLIDRKLRARSANVITTVGVERRTAPWL
jgi:hypothetical protein